MAKEEYKGLVPPCLFAYSETGPSEGEKAYIVLGESTSDEEGRERMPTGSLKMATGLSARVGEIFTETIYGKPPEGDKITPKWKDFLGFAGPARRDCIAEVGEIVYVGPSRGGGHRYGVKPSEGIGEDYLFDLFSYRQSRVVAHKNFAPSAKGEKLFYAQKELSIHGKRYAQGALVAESAFLPVDDFPDTDRAAESIENLVKAGVLLEAGRISSGGGVHPLTGVFFAYALDIAPKLERIIRDDGINHFWDTAYAVAAKESARAWSGSRSRAEI